MRKLLLGALVALSLTSCAAGSVTAGISAHAVQANQLTSTGEQKIVDRVKDEIAREAK